MGRAYWGRNRQPWKGDVEELHARRLLSAVAVLPTVSGPAPRAEVIRTPREAMHARREARADGAALRGEQARARLEARLERLARRFPTAIFTARTRSLSRLVPAPITVTGAGARSATDVARAIVDLTNIARAQNNLAPLTASTSLMQAATVHSQDMARLGILSHTLPGVPLASLSDRAAFVGYRYQSLGENIAFNQPDASGAVAGWLNSPPHRANMLGATFTEIGVGVAWDSRGQPYYTMVLGRPA